MTFFLFPHQICLHVAAGKKCQYIGNCTFAHSTEERDLWTYMKENNSKFSKLSDYVQIKIILASKENGKHIHMPTDYAEEVVRKLTNHMYTILFKEL